MRLFTILEQIVSSARYASDQAQRPNPEVVLIINGVAHPVEDVWWEARQGLEGSICIGFDPR